MATRLTGQAALEYLKNNPNASYVDNTTGTRVSAPQSGLSKIVSGITSPFRKGAGIAQEFGYTMADLINALQGKGAVERPESYALMTPEESQQLYQDPLKTGLKAGAGVASYTIGGPAKGTTTGARILNAAKTGAIGGSLSGFGYSENGNELGSTLTGGAIGGVAGGALQGLSELLKPVTKTGGKNILKTTAQDLQSPVGRPSATKGGINTYKKAQEISQTMENTIKENLPIIDEINPELAKKYKNGLISQTEKTILYEDIANSAAEKAGLMRDASGQVTDVAQLTKKITSDETMTPTMRTALRKSGFFEDLARIGKSSELGSGKITNVAKKGDLYDLLKSVDDSINYSRNINTPQPILEKALKVARRNIASEISSGLGSEYTKYNTIYSNFSKARDTGHLARITNDELGRTFAQGSNALKVPIVGDILGSQPVKQLQGQVRNKTGRLLEQLSGMGTISSNIPSQIAGTLAGRAGVAGGLIGGIAGAVPTTQDIQQQVVSGTITSDEINAALEAQYADNQAQRMLLFNQLLAQGYKTAEAKSIVDMNIPQMKKQTLSEAQRKALAAVNSLANFENEYAQGGVLASELPFGGVGTQGRQLATARKSLIEDIGRLQTGAVINAEEAKSFKDLVPTLLDDAETAQLKIAQLRERLSAYVDLTPQYSTEYDALKSVLGIQ